MNETKIYFVFLILWATGVLGSVVGPINLTIFELMFTSVDKIFSLFI